MLELSRAFTAKGAVSERPIVNSGLLLRLGGMADG